MQSNERSMWNWFATRSHGPRSGWSSVCGRSWKIINTWTQQLHWSLFYSSRSVPMCQKQSWVVSISLTHLCRTPLEQSTVSYPALKDTTGNNIFKSSLCLDGFSLSPFSQSTLLSTFFWKFTIYFTKARLGVKGRYIHTNVFVIIAAAYTIRSISIYSRVRTDRGSSDRFPIW